MKATIKEAIQDIKVGDYEYCFLGALRNHKRRNCIFCGKNIKKGEPYYKNFEYPYINLPRWFACEKCFKQIRKRV